MSAINEINKVWIQKFPGSSLPEAWTEDVKTNLAKHKKRVLELEEELEQEKVYVEFLETLLAEVRQGSPQTASSPPETSNGAGNTQDIDDVIKDTLERRSLAAHFIFPQAPNSKPNLHEGQNSKAKDGDASAKGDSREDIRKDQRVESPKENDPTEEEDSLEPAESNCPDDTTEERRDRDHFVTVIEVNGFDKKGPRSPSQSSSAEDRTRLKKVPPRPPPKCFKRQGSDTSQAESSLKEAVHPNDCHQLERENSDPSQKQNGDRPVIFDSRKLSSGNGNGVVSSVSEGSSTPSETSKSTQNPPFVPLKRYEGSKLPLPENQKREQDELPSERDQRSAGESRASFLKPLPQNSGEKEAPARSKILDLVNRMESSQKPMPPTKNNEVLTPRRSFRKQFQGPVYHSVSPEAAISDYVDPCDAEFDSTSNDQIYDSPPPEDFPSELESPQNRSKTSTLDTRISDSHLEPMYGKFMVSN
jgi:hypothetical protein